ncbi:MAG: hypothetical protein A2605_02465 [Candidatus Zambryskibacteria bacterium RIFOXYD1_FULL_39_35]|nr:MAG: hypothetical protein A2605_02465 [Candidatus Zambryskibacteria bacterium RIFOXYD1_FULL_39_35]
MKKFNKNSITLITLVTFLVFGLTLPINVLAGNPELTVDLGAAADFDILGETAITTTGATYVTGDIGISPAAATFMTGFGLTLDGTGTFSTSALVGGRIYAANYTAPTPANMTTAISNMLTAYNNAAGRPNPDGTELYDGIIGGQTFTPGLYKWTSDVTIPTDITLSGNASDIWIFQISGDLTIASAKSVLLTGGALASNVFWQVAGSNYGATLGTYSTFNGTILSAKQIRIQTGAVLNGRALAQTQVTLDANTISRTGVVVATQPATGGGSGYKYPSEGTINVVKSVINDSGGTKTVADFPLFVSGIPVVSGITNSFHAPFYPYAITETSDSNYVQTFSGDCDSNGLLNLNPSDIKFCIVTNDDIGPSVVVPPVPPLIDVVKVPSPLALPTGPGSVTYTYTLRNIGTVPATNITMVGDTCIPITLASGDTNTDAKLDVNETWVYRCSTTLSQTHTNTVTATGWANGVSAVDVASATVVVGASIVPPLIHVVKKPSTFTLLAPGGPVTYTYTVTNPGTAPLSNVSITDDKCTGLPGRVLGHPGDINKNNLLESNESWSFTCQTNLAKTTTNTAIASGEANGLTVRDLAVATVVVAAVVPGLPNSGIAPDEKNISLNIALILVGLSTVSIFFYFIRRKQTLV